MRPAASLVLAAALLLLVTAAAAVSSTAPSTSPEPDEQRLAAAANLVDDWQALTDAYVRGDAGASSALRPTAPEACAQAESGGGAATHTDPRQWLVGSDDVGVTPCRIQVRVHAAGGRAKRGKRA